MKKLIFPMSIFILFLLCFMFYLIVPKQDEFIFMSKYKDFKFKYHFVLIGEQSNSLYWDNLKKGAEKSAREHNIVMQFMNSRNMVYSKNSSLLEMAIDSKVDGIITYVPDEDIFLPIINEAVEKGIPVITIEKDLPKSKRISYVGINNYESGEKAANELLKQFNQNTKVAIFAGNYDSVQQSIKVQGFIDALGNGDVEVVKIIETSNTDIMDSMYKARLLINSGINVDTFFCTDPINTYGVARAIVDLNRVGSIKIIGFGDLPEIKRYIEKGVIDTTIVQDPFMIGKLTVENLYNYKIGKQISEYILTDIKILSKKLS